jgi:hypothetical protein
LLEGYSPDDKKRSLQRFLKRPNSMKDNPKDNKNAILQKVNQITKINAEKEKLKEEVFFY